MKANQIGVERFLDSLTIQPLCGSDCEAISELHFTVLPWSFNGSMGLQHMRDLYGQLLDCPHVFGYVVRHRGTILGFTTATTNSRAARRVVQEVYKKRPLKTLSKLLRPDFFAGVIESKLAVPYFLKKNNIEAEWLTMVTDMTKGFVAPLVALKLTDAVRDHFRGAGISTYAAQGVKNNPKAIQMYEALGWTVAAVLPMHYIYVYASDAPNSAAVLGSGK